MKLAKQKVYSARDSKIHLWTNPMFFLHAGQAERTWRELVNDPQTMVAKHPGDFDLYQIGEFDDDTGILSPITPPVLLMTGVGAKEGPAPDALPFTRSK